MKTYSRSTACETQFEVTVASTKSKPIDAYSSRQKRSKYFAEQKKGGWKACGKRLLAELLGTFLLTFIDAGSGMIAGISSEVSLGMRAVAPGLFVMAFIYAFGDVAGAHINPAVTLSFALRGVFPWRRVAGYWVAQLSGSLLAAGLLYNLFGSVAHLGATIPHYGHAVAFVMEIVITFALVSVILGTADRHMIVGPSAALAVGATIAACGLSTKPISGASMNPARSFGPALLGGGFSSYWIYFLGPMLGGMLAVGVARILHGKPPDVELAAAQGEE